MRIIFMGTPDLAECILEEIINSDNEVVAAVTKVDKPKGRGNEMTASPVKLLATKYNIPVLQPEKAKDEGFINELKSYDADLIVVAAYGKILPKEILELPKFGCINVHTSLLPKYRGAAPIQWAIINGDKETGVSIQYMAEGIDTGDIINTCIVPLLENETADSLFDKLAKEGAKLTIETIKLISEGNVIRVPQDHSQATYVTTINKYFGHIDYANSATQIERLIRGLNPWPSAFSYLNGKQIKLWKAIVLEDKKDKAQDGTIVSVDKDSFTIKCGEGYLKVTECQLEGKKRMLSTDFLCGYKLEVGTILN